jgi:hypothetical protein
VKAQPAEDESHQNFPKKKAQRRGFETALFQNLVPGIDCSAASEVLKQLLAKAFC